MKWIPIREYAPPEHLSVLFYIKDNLEGYTEDRVAQGSRYVGSEGKNIYEAIGHDIDEDGKGQLEITHWTLLPNPPSVL